MAGMRKFLGGVVSGGLVAAVTLVVASQLSAPQGPGAVPAPVKEPVAAASESATPAAVTAATEAVAAPVQTSGGNTVPAGAQVTPAEPATTSASEGQITAETTATAANANGGLVVAPKPAANVAGAGVPETGLAVPAAEAAPEVSAVAAPPPAQPQVDLPAPSLPESADAAPTPAAEAAGSLTAQLPVPPAAPNADGAPESAELPPPPPLTEEEIAKLADPTLLALPVEEPVAAPVAAGPAAQADPALGQVENDALQSPVIDVPDQEIVVVEEPPAPEPVPAQEPMPESESAAVVVAVPNPVLPEAGLESGEPSTLAPTPRLIGSGEGSLIERETAESAETEAEAEAENAAALPEVALADAPALERFAAAFTNPDSKPLFGILLLDSGEPTLDRQAVASLPFPVSIVIDPLAPDAASLAALYRAGGKEVIMLATGIPEGATPADVEQTFQAHAATLPEAVALVDGSVAAFQDDRPLSTQIVPILAAQGRGLLTWDRGLNAADQVARREGLPTAMIFRQIDAEGESVPVMRRYLDRAAFRAAQEGHAIVIGTIQSETIAALLEWTIEGRASTVALAPASALLAAP